MSGYRRQRLLVAAAVLAIFVIIAVRSFVGSGYDATLVAEVGVSRAPLAGVASSLSAEVGDRVARNQSLGVFAVPTGLAAAVASGSEDVDELGKELASVDRQYAALKANEGLIRSDASQYRLATLGQIDAQDSELQAEIASANSQVVLSQQQEERITRLFASGFSTKSDLQVAQQKVLGARAERDAALAKRKSNDVTRAAAEKGMLLSSGYSNVQYSTQRLSDLTLAMNQLMGEHDRLAAKLAAAKALSTGSTAITRALRFPIRSTVDGRIWTRDAAPGETLREGDPIFTIADCSSFFAYFTVGRRPYSSLSVGLPVTFVANSNGKRWPGTIVNMGVSNVDLFRVTNKIETPAEGQHLIGARIQLPAADQKICPVGTAGRVIL